MADHTAALRDLLDPLAVGGAHRVSVPQGTALPYIRLQAISDPRDEDLDGYQAFRESRVQVDCFAASNGAARALAVAVVEATDAPMTTGGVTFGRIRIQGPRDLIDEVPNQAIHRASLDMIVWHNGE